MMKRKNKSRPQTLGQLEQRLTQLRIEQDLLKKAMKNNYNYSQLVMEKWLFKLITIAGVGVVSATLLKSIQKEIEDKPVAQVLLNFALQNLSPNGHSTTETEPDHVKQE